MNSSNIIQDSTELDEFYSSADPWGYDTNPEDELRLQNLMALISKYKPNRTLDIGCGNGFVTSKLPGNEVLGIDLSTNAVRYARERVAKLENSDRFKFETQNFFDLNSKGIGSFDLIVITGVLYPQYIGGAISNARIIIDDLINKGGIIASCHIANWNPPRLPYTLIDQSLYAYRQYTHLLEVVKS